jgi:hypothetical protein
VTENGRTRRIPRLEAILLRAAKGKRDVVARFPTDARRVALTPKVSGRPISAATCIHSMLQTMLEHRGKKFRLYVF